MTISKEKFEQIVLEVAQQHGQESIDQATLAFAHALIRRVEAESKVVGYNHKSIPNETSFDHLDYDSYDDAYGRKHWISTPLVALPLVGE